MAERTKSKDLIFSIPPKKAFFETLKQEVQSLVLEKYDLEYRKTVKTSSSCLAFSNNENSNAEKKIKAFQSKTFEKQENQSIEHLMKEIEMVVTDKQSLYVVMSQKYKLVLEPLTHQNSETRNTIKTLKVDSFTTFVCQSSETKIYENKQSVNERIWDWNYRSIIFLAELETSHYQNSTTMNKTNHFLIEYYWVFLTFQLRSRWKKSRL